MSIVKDLAILQYLTNKIITQKGVGEALNFTKGAINNRIIRGGDFKPDEKKRLEDFYGISFDDFKEATPNTHEPKDNEQVLKNFEHFGARLNELQGELGYLDKAMARIMGTDEKRYMRIKLGKEDATAQELARLASKVDVSIDWLMFGE